MGTRGTRRRRSRSQSIDGWRSCGFLVLHGYAVVPRRGVPQRRRGREVADLEGLGGEEADNST
jgi:hypothetical protein